MSLDRRGAGLQGITVGRTSVGFAVTALVWPARYVEVLLSDFSRWYPRRRPPVIVTGATTFTCSAAVLLFRLPSTATIEIARVVVLMLVDWKT